jgi:hypothetical protein
MGLSVTYNGGLYSSLCGLNRGDFQDRYKAFAFILRAFPVAPSISTFGLGVASQIEYLDATTPNGLAAKHLMHRHSSAVNRPALVQLLNCDLKPRQIICSAMHD